MIILKLSLIIPIYNEEHHIARCLSAAINQSVPFDEIIVVDNNCTDNSIKIAKTFKQVRIVKETKQGLIAARNKGFSVAKGDILCRIDADAEVSYNWAETVRTQFENDKELSGVTGLALTSLLPRIKHPLTKIYAKGYFWGIGTVFKTQVLWGANMAIRRSAWLKAKKYTSPDDHIVHEDQDLSLSILVDNGILKLNRDLLIATGGQTYHYFPKLVEYINRSNSTYRLHKERGHVPVIESLRFSKTSLFFRYLTLYTIGLLFALSSLIFWPIDSLMLKIGHQKTWFH